jgi:NAD(P)-dependent dehydrogenase (short-subunit alcohol dehydrogenase family)
VSKEGRIAGKVALVTGGGSGIGRATALLLAAEGASVAVADINGDAARETASAIEAEGGRALAVEGDVSTEQGAEAIVRTSLDEFGRLDILDNNAGVGDDKPLSEVDETYLSWMIGVNLKGPIYMAKHATSAMIAGGNGGAIVNIASIAALRSRPEMPVYVATKGAIVAFTRSLAIDFAEYGIRTNCICPLATDTPLLRARFESMPDGAERYQRNIDTNPLRRLARPVDIANAVLFLVSDEASYINGQAIVIDGGSIAGTALY